MGRINDGVHISIYETYSGPQKSIFDTSKQQNKLSESRTIKGHETVLAEDSSGNVIKDLSSCEGEYVNKKYYERIPCEFDGFIVGITKIKAEGRIGTEWESDPHYEEYGHCFKESTWQPKVGVVYFRNNCKRYVLLDDMEETEKTD